MPWTSPRRTLKFKMRFREKVTMSETDTPGYQVLARKYRPASFADLIGQDAMVRILKNAFQADRIAQAFILTGIRGTGKTTTARIIAKGLNCIGPDGTGGPTIEPCGQCEPCVAITEGRHVDVMEMDAASRTGVNDIREIIDSVHYRAASARYKIYIIDEVHMLSKNAFNALLKTLEEPPEHVKFIFATTEIRQVPVTVLSRCQRFDLRRIEPEVMIENLKMIAALEKAEIADDALALITRAAEGSVRDAQSLLDQAIAHGAGETTAAQVRAMLGLADRGRVLDLFELIARGDAGAALAEVSSQYAEGADPMAVLRDLAEVTHWFSVIKITPEAVEDPTVSPDEPDPRRRAGRGPGDAGADADVADVAESAGRGGAGPQCDDGRRNGNYPPHPRGRPSHARRPGTQAQRQPAAGAAGRAGKRVTRWRIGRSDPGDSNASRRRAHGPQCGRSRDSPCDGTRNGAGALCPLRRHRGPDPRQPGCKSVGRGRDRPASGRLCARAD